MGGSCSNIKKHRKSRNCTLHATQLRFGQIQKPKKVTQARLRKLVVEAVVDCNLPFSIVENPSFKNLVTDGQGRITLHVPSRRTVSKDIFLQYEKSMSSLCSSIAGSISNLSITFDLWTDRSTRGFVAVTGHYFDAEYVLRSPLLSIEFLEKSTEGHTADRL